MERQVYEMAVSHTTVLGKSYKFKSQMKSAASTTIEEAIATLARVAPDDGRVLAGDRALCPPAWRDRAMIDINDWQRSRVVRWKVAQPMSVANFTKLVASKNSRWKPLVASAGLVGKGN